MALVGELVSLLVSLAQEIGVVAGVGALTITLVGHLLSLHAHKNETVFGYVRAARQIRALALMVIIISGGAAILIHFQSGTPDVLVAPAFLFKWLLIALLTAFYFAELNVDGIKRDAVEGFEGANWYALFIVHAMAPVAGWGLLLGIYSGWLATFAAIWAGFVWIMRGHAMPKFKIAHKPVPVPASVAPKPAPSPAPAPAPVEPQEPVSTPAPDAQKTIEMHPNHSILPMIAELDLPAPLPKVPAPAPAVPVVAPPAPAPVMPEPKPVPPPVEAPVVVVPESPKPSVQMPNLEESGLPALHVMPKRPEDIESSKRGPVVKMSEE